MGDTERLCVQKPHRALLRITNHWTTRECPNPMIYKVVFVSILVDYELLKARF